MALLRRALLIQTAAVGLGLAPADRAFARRKRLHSAHASRRQKPLVVIDPGHGGKDPGCIGAGGTEEKSVVLALGLKLEHELLASRRFRVAMTRRTDVFIPLGDRVSFARKHGASVFVSIHANASHDHHARGACVYRFAYRASSAASAAVARWENSADRYVGATFRDASPAVAHILASLMRRETWLHSARLQDCVAHGLRDSLGGSRVSENHAHFVVLGAPEIPSVLVESGFLTNAEDARELRDSHHRLVLAKALRSGIEKYVAR